MYSKFSGIRKKEKKVAQGSVPFLPSDLLEENVQEQKELSGVVGANLTIFDDTKLDVIASKVKYLDSLKSKELYSSHGSHKYYNQARNEPSTRSLKHNHEPYKTRYLT